MFKSSLLAGLNILICNAGTALPGTIAATTLEMYERMMALNVRAPFLLTKYAEPHLEKTKGNILYISSGAGDFSTYTC